MADVLGPTFGQEVIAAGLGGLPFSWSPNGWISGRENLTAEQNTTLDAVIAAHNPTMQLKNIIQFDDFIRRWTNAEYRLMLADRTNAGAGGSMSVAKNWDVAFARGNVDLNNQLMQNLKSDIVAAGILTQARADEIFS